MLCELCHCAMDPVWVQAGYTAHFTCAPFRECDHGEPRGPRYCALCRHADPRIMPPGLVEV